MSQINQLSSVSSTEATGSDNLVLFSNSNGDSRKFALTQLIEYIRTNLTESDYIINLTTPSDGFTLTITQDGQNRWEILRPTSGLATGQIVLPAPTVAVDGQQILVTSDEAITSLVVNGNGATEVKGQPTSMSANDRFTMKYHKLTDAWYRIA